MTEAKINERLAAIEAKIEPLRQEAKALVRERDALQAQKTAAAKLAAMSDAEREALGIPQSLSGVGGVQSEESVQG